MLVLIRHGETQANKERRYLGKIEESLSESGKLQLRKNKIQHFYPQIDYLFTSPMKRCIETAEILYPALYPIVIPEWTEIDFGRFEYKNYEELKEDVQYQAWIDSGGTLAFPEGECRDAFIRRCESGWITMCKILTNVKSVRVGAIVHGGTIMALLSSYGKKPYFDCQAANGRGYICYLSSWKSNVIKEVTAL